MGRWCSTRFLLHNPAFLTLTVAVVALIVWYVGLIWSFRESRHFWNLPPGQEDTGPIFGGLRVYVFLADTWYVPILLMCVIIATAAWLGCAARESPGTQHSFAGRKTKKPIGSHDQTGDGRE